MRLSLRELESKGWSDLAARTRGALAGARANSRQGHTQSDLLRWIKGLKFVLAMQLEAEDSLHLLG
jgi:hypothetical protein